MDPFGFGRIIADKWDVLMMSPGVSVAVLGFGLVFGIALTRIFLNERLTQQQDMIAKLRAILEEKLPAHFLPSQKRNRLMSFSLVLGGLGLAFFGLAMAATGLFGEWRRAPTADPQIAQLQTEIVRLRSELGNATKLTPETKASAAPSKNVVAYNERDIRELLDSLDEASALLEKHILPTAAATNSMTANWRGAIPNAGVKTFADNLRKMKAAQKIEIWDPINELVYSPSNRHQDEMRVAFALDDEAAKGELARSLQVAIEAVEKLPENSSETTRDLLTRDFAEADRQAVIVWNWAMKARNRVASMKTNLKTQGVTGFAGDGRSLPIK